jgi:hypothetical protein
MSQKYEKDTTKYHATHQRPQRPDTNVITRIGRLSPAAKCLDQVLEELMQEQSYSLIDCGRRDSEDDTEGITARGIAGEENIQISQQFRNDVVDQFGLATFDAFYQNDKKNKYPSQNDLDQVINNREAFQDEPPAALLHGKVKYYNRFGGQWRIVVSDAEIRSRVNVDYKRLKKSENCSLKEMHRIQVANESDLASRDAMNHPQLELDNDKVFKIDGDLIILACDDI